MLIGRSKIVVAVALGALTFLASSALARTVPARVGGSYSGADTCFKDYDVGMRNECGGARWYDIGLPIDSPGVKTFDVHGSAMNSCWFIELTSAGLMNDTLMTVVTSGYHTITINVPIGSFIKLQCNINNNAYLYGVDYDP
jgi:hypothetical protein